MDARKTIAEARRILKEDRTMDAPQIAASLLSDLPEVKAAGLEDLAWILGSWRFNVHRNDVIGLIELLEAYLDRGIVETEEQEEGNASDNND